MAASNAFLIEQARALTAKPRLAGLALKASQLGCMVKIRYLCQGASVHVEYDRTGELILPVPCCNRCRSYLDRCYRKDDHSAEAQARIWHAAALTYQALLNQ